MLFRKYFNNYESQITKLRKKTYQLNEQINNLKKEIKDNDEKIKRIQFLLNKKARDGSYSLLEYTEKGILSLTFIKKDISEINIEIFSIDDEYYSRNRAIFLWAKKVNLKESIMSLESIEGGRSKGHGNIAMKHFLNYCKEQEQDIKTIQGEIGTADYGHIDRLKSFYGKFGFEVTVNDEKKNGSFRKLLK